MEEQTLRRRRPSAHKTIYQYELDEEEADEPDYSVFNICNDQFWIRVGQVLFLLITSIFILYSYHYSDDVLHRIHLAYAHLGHAEAQHKIAQRYLQGVGVEKDYKKAAHWFKKAAAGGHVHAQYNLAVAHMKEHTTLRKGEAKRLVEKAAAAGIPAAIHVEKNICRNGKSKYCE